MLPKVFFWGGGLFWKSSLTRQKPRGPIAVASPARQATVRLGLLQLSTMQWRVHEERIQYQWRVSSWACFSSSSFSVFHHGLANPIPDLFLFVTTKFHVLPKGFSRLGHPLYSLEERRLDRLIHHTPWMATNLMFKYHEQRIKSIMFSHICTEDLFNFGHIKYS